MAVRFEKHDFGVESPPQIVYQIRQSNTRCNDSLQLGLETFRDPATESYFVRRDLKVNKRDIPYVAARRSGTPEGAQLLSY